MRDEVVVYRAEGVSRCPGLETWFDTYDHTYSSSFGNSYLHHTVKILTYLLDNTTPGPSSQTTSSGSAITIDRSINRSKRQRDFKPYSMRKRMQLGTSSGRNAKDQGKGKGKETIEISDDDDNYALWELTESSDENRDGDEDLFS